MSNEYVALGGVQEDFLNRVEAYQGNQFLRVGDFDINLLREMVEQIEERDGIGTVTLLVTSKNKMHDDTTSGLIVVKYNCDKYIALAGLTDVTE